MSGLEVALNVLISLFLIALAGVVVYLVKYYPSRLYNHVVSGNMVKNKKEKTLMKKIDAELTQMWINNDPLIVEPFPDSLNYAEQNNMIPQFSGGLLGKILSGVLMAMGNNPDAPAALRMAGKLSSFAGAETTGAVTDGIMGFIASLFGKRGEKKPREPMELVEKKEQKDKKSNSKLTYGQ